MADDPMTQLPPAPAAVAGPPAIDAQLTQVRVPLDRAAEAFAVPDASGRLPIVVLPDQPFRIRNEFVIVGAILIVVGFVLDLELPLRGGLLGLGVIAVFLGVFQSFIVGVPEGAQALLLKGGRYWRTVGAGRHIVPPVDRGVAPGHDPRDPVRVGDPGHAHERRRARRPRAPADIPDHGPGPIRVRDLGAGLRRGLPRRHARGIAPPRPEQAIRRDPRPRR